MATKAYSMTSGICVRFQTGDLDRITKVANRAGKWRSTWLREVLLDRADKVLAGKRAGTLESSTPKGVGEQVCVRFQERDFERIQKAATKEKMRSTSSWIRAVIVAQIQRAESAA